MSWYLYVLALYKWWCGSVFFMLITLALDCASCDHCPLQAGRDSYMSCVIHYRVLYMDSVPVWKCLRATASWSCEAALWAHFLPNSTYLWILSIAPHSYILSWCWWQHSAFQISELPHHLLLLHLYFVTCQPVAFIKLFLLGFCADFKVICLSLSLSFFLFFLTSRPIQLRIMSQMNQPRHRITNQLGSTPVIL